MNFLDERLPERFWSKCTPEPNTGCWLWHAAADHLGYGRFGLGDGTRALVLSHRHSFSRLVRPLIPGLVLDHRVCKTPACVNPAHLEEVTLAENTARGRSRELTLLRGRIFRSIPEPTHCYAGHEYTEANTYRRKSKGGWPTMECRKCNAARTARRKVQIKEARP